MELDGKHAALLCFISFGFGVCAGYKIKEQRIKYLKWKRDRLCKKLNETQERLHVEARGDLL